MKEINLDLPELLGKSETVTSPGASVQLPHNATSASVEVQGAMRAVEVEEVRRNLYTQPKAIGSTFAVSPFVSAEKTESGLLLTVNDRPEAGETILRPNNYRLRVPLHQNAQYIYSRDIQNLNDYDIVYGLQLEYRNSDGGAVGWRGFYVSVPANSTVRAIFRFPLLEGVATVDICDREGLKTSEVLPIRAKLLLLNGWTIEEDHGQTLTPLYGGMDFTEYDPDPRYSVEWTGEPNNSESILVHRHEIEDITGGANIELTPIEQVTVNGQTIDLQGNFLAALPNGVKDTLTATPEGTTITKRVGMEGGQSFEVEPYTVQLDYSLPPVQGGEEMSVDTSLPTEIVWRYDTVRYIKPRVIELEVER